MAARPPVGRATDWRERGMVVERESRPLMRLDGKTRLAVMLGRCPVPGVRRWTIQLQFARPLPDWVLVARLDPNGEAVQDYCLTLCTSFLIMLGVRQRKDRERHFADTLHPLLDLIAGRGHGGGPPEGIPPQ